MLLLEWKHVILLCCHFRILWAYHSNYYATTPMASMVPSYKNILQHDCAKLNWYGQYYEKRIADEMQVRPGFSIVVIKSPINVEKCSYETDLKRLKFAFAFRNEKRGREDFVSCNVQIYCKDMVFGAYCHNYQLWLYTRRLHLEFNAPPTDPEEVVMAEKICNTTHAFQRTIQPHEELVIELTYNQKYIQIQEDVFSCGVYYTCQTYDASSEDQSGSNEITTPRYHQPIIVMPTQSLPKYYSWNDPLEYYSNYPGPHHDYDHRSNHLPNHGWADEATTTTIGFREIATTALGNGLEQATTDTASPSGSLCFTVDGQVCAQGPWIWSEGPGIFAHFVNCIPMTGEGRNIFDLAAHPQAIQGRDYEFYCPITLDNEGKVNKNQPDYFAAMKKCQLQQPELGNRCKTTKTLEQQFSRKEEGTCLTVSGQSCIPHVWRDLLGRWYRGCRQIGQRNPKWECATATNTEGFVVSISDCSSQNCQLHGPQQLTRNPNDRFVLT